MAPGGARQQRHSVVVGERRHDHDVLAGDAERAARREQHHQLRADVEEPADEPVQTVNLLAVVDHEQRRLFREAALDDIARVGLVDDGPSRGGGDCER